MVVSPELQEIKTEIAMLVTRLENTEGYFDNFDVTLNNHMTDYNRALSELRNWFTWAFWVLFGLMTLVLGGFVAVFGNLLQVLLEGAK